jgi:hypothetical protein
VEVLATALSTEQGMKTKGIKPNKSRWTNKNQKPMTAVEQDRADPAAHQRQQKWNHAHAQRWELRI